MLKTKLARLGWIQFETEFCHLGQNNNLAAWAGLYIQ